MLTPNELHMLVGLLLSSTKPDAVEVELGSLVLDKSASEERDVDVTVRFEHEASGPHRLEAFEVKHHTRPLDVAQVEQLCEKLNDMPSLAVTGVVSSSGYTKPAVRKALDKGIQLFRFDEWRDPETTFEHVRWNRDLEVTNDFYRWEGTAGLTFQLHDRDLPLASLEPSTPIYNVNGEIISDCPDAESLGRAVFSQIGSGKHPDGRPMEIAPNEELTVQFAADLEFRPCVMINGELAEIHSAVGRGKIRHVVESRRPMLRALRREGDQHPYIACAIFETMYGSLSAIVFDNASRAIRFVNIDPNSRQLKKIKQFRLK